MIDFCIEVEPERVRQFIEKWNLLNGDEDRFTETQRLQILSESPLSIGFSAAANINDVKIRQNHGCGVSWVPQSCLLEGTWDNTEAQYVLEHYGYDLNRGWWIQRLSFPWADKRSRSIRSLSLTLEREMAEIPGTSFKAPAAGESITLTNPVTGQEHILTVRESEAQEIDQSHFRDDSMEYPAHCVGLTYTIFPELQDFYLRDCDNGDGPRAKHQNPDGPIIGGAVGVIGMIRNDDSQTVYLHPDGTPAKARAFCSSLHFEPVKELTLNIVFREKRIPDIEVKIIQ